MQQIKRLLILPSLTLRSFIKNELDDTPTKESLWVKADHLCEKLPKNTLDVLIKELGGREHVAEASTNEHHVLEINDLFNVSLYAQSSTNNITLQLSGRTLPNIPGTGRKRTTLSELEDFQNGKRLIAIITPKASTGFCLHSDKNVENQRRRVHITAEFPWKPEDISQQLGRIDCWYYRNNLRLRKDKFSDFHN
jgi:hypothetical protein